MRQVLVRCVALIGLCALGACSIAPHASVTPSGGAPIAGSHGYLAASDEVGRAAFRGSAAGDDEARMVSVPILVD